MDYRVYKVIAAVENDLAKNWNVDKLASLVNISPHHFHKIFRAETGSTPMQYLAMLRLNKARELLESTFLSIKEIRQAVGMPEESTFAREFRNKFGCSPSEFRLRAWETEQIKSDKSYDHDLTL